MGTRHFFQCHWDICCDKVSAIILCILREEESLKNINETLLVLISKAKGPSSLSQLRPPCSVLYKIASKVLSNRLKLILPHNISEEQLAFVLGRLITDNIMSAYECLRFMKRNKAKKNRLCTLKLDMMKAYDRME